MARSTSLHSAGTQRARSQPSERDQLVLEYLPLVKSVASRVRGRLPVHVDFDDLVHVGVLGLLDAATKYQADRHVMFATYAKHRIRGAILDSLRQMDWASRDTRRRLKQIEAATQELTAALKRAPTESEIAQKLGMDLDRWHEVMFEVRTFGLVSASTPPKRDEDQPAYDFPSKPETQPDSICGRQEMQSVLNGAIKNLSFRHQEVIRMYYGREMTMKEIGKALKVNESRVSQIHRLALKKMQAALQTAGINSSEAF